MRLEHSQTPNKKIKLKYIKYQNKIIPLLGI